jgi:flagellar basal body-associated protein FliL
LSLKENIEAVKKEIGTEEQFLEGIIKSERFFKKYKKSIIITSIVAVLAGSTYATLNVLKENRLESSNEAYNKLIKNPNDSESLTVLKDKNERLYNFYRFQKALENNDVKVLKELSEYKQDPIISDLASYQLDGLEGKSDSKSELLSGFIALQEGYKLLKADKVEEAKLKFAQIQLNSPLKNISNNLEHYQGIKSKGSN